MTAGFVAAFVLMPGWWLVMAAFFIGGACLAGLFSFLFAWRLLGPGEVFYVERSSRTA